MVISHQFLLLNASNNVFVQMLLFCSSSALEAGPGSSEGLLGGMSIPVGMTRRAFSYDDNLERPMSPPPTDININNLWRRPVIPERKFARLAEVCVDFLFFDRFAHINMQIQYTHTYIIESCGKESTPFWILWYYVSDIIKNLLALGTS